MKYHNKYIIILRLNIKVKEYELFMALSLKELASIPFFCTLTIIFTSKASDITQRILNGNAIMTFNGDMTISLRLSAN